MRVRPGGSLHKTLRTISGVILALDALAIAAVSAYVVHAEFNLKFDPFTYEELPPDPLVVAGVSLGGVVSVALIMVTLATWTRRQGRAVLAIRTIPVFGAVSVRVAGLGLYALIGALWSTADNAVISLYLLVSGAALALTWLLDRSSRRRESDASGHQRVGP